MVTRALLTDLQIRYSIGAVLGTLAIVEQPETNVVLEVDPLGEDEQGTKATDGLLASEVVVTKTRPVTSKIRTAFAHLRARAGKGSRFRGLGIYIVYGMLKNMAAAFFASAIPTHIGRALGFVAAEVLLCQFEMTWYQIVISEPSPKAWYRRILPRKYWGKVAPAALLKSVAAQLTIGLPAAMLCLSKPVREIMRDPSYRLDKAELHQVAAVFIGAAISWFTLLFLVYVPAYVTMVRVSASMLPEEDETIVPFDRSFGGKVTPMIVGGSGKIGLLDAWKTFSWEARRRFIGLMAKVVAISTAVTVLFCMVLSAEVALFADSQTKELLASRFTHQ